MKEEKKVKDLMTEDPINAELPGNRVDVINKMIEHELTGMPVVKDSELKGLITRIDFFKNPGEDQLALIYRKDQPDILQDASIKEATKIFIENETHYLPVKDEKNSCVGILTTADILPYISEKEIQLPVEEVIGRECVPLYEKTPIKVALQTMSLTGIYAFPVVDGETVLTGIITDRDLFDMSEINGQIEKSDLGLEDDEESWSWQGLKNVMKLYYEESMIDLPNICVDDVMVEDPLTVYDQTTVSKAAQMMTENDFGQLPVVNEMDSLEAMLYELDLIETLL
ncbi:MAG: CBS domain-containing protein [Candidatus Thermoplasmatota archaeon]|nr:CBS domain-containing protein [Candidatus Thermoplasmatota archaeon]